MPRPRDRQSATGLLPRMEARTRKDGQITYRFHPLQADGSRTARKIYGAWWGKVDKAID